MKNLIKKILREEGDLDWVGQHSPYEDIDMDDVLHKETQSFELQVKLKFYEVLEIFNSYCWWLVTLNNGGVVFISVDPLVQYMGNNIEYHSSIDKFMKENSRYLGFANLQNSEDLLTKDNDQLNQDWEGMGYGDWRQKIFIQVKSQLGNIFKEMFPESTGVYQFWF
jgi:hypothetical protein